MRQSRVLVFGLSLAGIVSMPLGAQTLPTVPDPHLTPGSVIPGYQMRCTPPYSPRRVWHDKVGTLRKYGLPPSAAGLVEDDDLIPVCLGGDNASPLNHWPMQCTQWSAGWRCVSGPAAEKDKLEAEACRQVCAGKLSQQEAQEFFREFGR